MKVIPPKIAYIVNPDWKEGINGVATFVRLVESYWRNNYNYTLIEYPETAQINHHVVENKNASKSIRQTRNKKFTSLGLLLGYINELITDIQFFRSIKSKLVGRILISNQFGCEVQPIALRIVCPKSLIVTIVHTHSGQDLAAMHPVRCFIEKWCYRMSSLLVCNSHAVKNDWTSKLGIALDKTLVIHYGLEAPDMTLPQEYPQKDSGVIDFVCVSRFANWKGQRKLLVAWKRAQENIKKPMRLILVGDGQTLEECKEVAKNLRIDDSVIFTGALVNGARFFNGADVAVQLSTEPEAFGLVLLEAMSRRKPVLASCVGGITEVVSNKSGILVDPNNIESVADAICRLRNEEKLRTSMGEVGRARWEKSFSIERMLTEYDNLFHDLVRN